MSRSLPNLAVTGPASIGPLGLAPDVYQELFASELEPRSPTQKAILRVAHWVFITPESDGAREREWALWRSASERGINNAVLSVPARFQVDPDSDSQVTSLRRRASEHAIELFFDFGKLGPPPRLEKDFCVCDPLWFKEKPWGRYWKVHGWRESWWVRRYSSAQLKQIANAVGEFEPKFLVMGHSHRIEQLRELRALLDSKY